MRRPSLFCRLLSGFLAIVVIFFLIGMGIYNRGIDMIRKKIIDEKCVLNRNFTNDLDREFKRIITLQYELADNWDLIQLSTPLANNIRDFNKSNMLLRIQEKLNAIKTSSRLVNNIKLIIPQINREIDTSRIGSYTEDAAWVLGHYPFIQKRQLLFHNDKLLLVAEYPPIYYKRDLEAYYLIYAEVPKSQLLQFLDEISLDNLGGSFLVSNSREMLITNGDFAITQSVQQSIKSAPKLAMEATSAKNTFVLYPRINGERYIVIYTDTGVQDLVLVHYVSEKEAFSGLAPYQTMVWVFGIVAAILVVIFTHSLYTAIHSPLHKLVGAFKSLQKGDFRVCIQDKRTDEFQYIYSGFNEMVAQLEDLIDQAYRQKTLAERAKLKHLQSQINPHFLYNSFLILSNRIALGDNVFASDFCREIGSYFSFVTRSNKDFVSLDFEIQHAITYANIQKARFGDRVKMHFASLPKELSDLQVPRLIIQPILENAFEHTLENMEANGQLYLRYEPDTSHIDIIVEDNGLELSDEKIQELIVRLDREDVEATGIINIHRRLKLVYPAGGGLSLERSQYGGLCVRVRVLFEPIAELFSL